MSAKIKAVSDEVLSKEFPSQFKTEADVSRCLKQLYAQVLEKMTEGEMNVHLGYKKNSVAGNNSDNSRNGAFPKKIQTTLRQPVISVPRGRNEEFASLQYPNMIAETFPLKNLSFPYMPRV